MKLVLILLAFTATLLSEEKKVSDFYEEAKKCETIACIRTEIDRINDQILVLLAERTAYVKRAGDIKSKKSKIAEDKQRILDQQKKIAERSLELGIPEEITVPALTHIMEASTAFQQSYIDSLNQ